MMDQNNRPHPQKGSIFFYILIAVVLLAALSFAVMQGTRTGTSTVSEQRSRIITSEIIEQSEAAALAVQKLILRGFDETEISFENSTEAGYTLAACATDDCRIFADAGGAINWMLPPADANDGENWVYSGDMPINGNGSNPYYDITMILPNIDADICRRLNFELNVTTALNDPIPVANDTTLQANKLATANPINASPNFVDGTDIDNQYSVCVEIVNSSGEFVGVPANSFFFIHTLYAG